MTTAEKFNLSEKLFVAYGNLWLKPEDVKEFINHIKRICYTKINFGNTTGYEDLMDEIDKLAGSKLTK